MKDRADNPRPRKARADPGSGKAAAPAAEAKTRQGRKPLPAHCGQIGLVLQGGGALGAYQAGVYEALAERGYQPDWVAGISIGAINGAIIAGNPPERRVERLREFWELITDGIAGKPLLDGDVAPRHFNEWSALASIASGVAGFFRPRMPPAWLQPWGTEGALSFYDTAPLRRRSSGWSISTCSTPGDARSQRRRRQHPQGQLGLFRHAASAGSGRSTSWRAPPCRRAFRRSRSTASTTGTAASLQHAAAVFARRCTRDASMLVFQVDLFSARGSMPRNLLDVYERAQGHPLFLRTRQEHQRRARRPETASAPSSGCYRKLPASSRTTPTSAYIREPARAAA